MCTGLLKKLWADLDEYFTVNSHWADLEIIIFLSQLPWEGVSLKGQNIRSMIQQWVTLQQSHHI